jgi:VanZ family protein
MIFSGKPREKEATSWVWVAAWVAFIYLAIPLARSLQVVIRERGGKAAFLWLTFLCFAAAAGWVVRALVRKQWAARPAQLLVLAAIGGSLSWMTWSLRENPEEAFHFVQYGVLSLLLFRALSHRLQDPSIYVAGVLIGAAFGTFDELIQWGVPQRYFDYRDIGINVLAVGLVQVALAAGIRPELVRDRPSWTGMQTCCRAVFVNGLLLLFCVTSTPDRVDFYSRHLPKAISLDQATAEYGFRIAAPGIGFFFSRLPAEELRRQDRDHGAKAAETIGWTRNLKQYVRFLEVTPAHRDPLAVEARIHLFRRDRHAAEALNPEDPKVAHNYAFVAHRENQILKAYFSNTLHHSIFRWPEERERRIAELSRGERPYVSPVSSQLITRVSRAEASGILLLIMLLAALGERGAARRNHP